MRLSAMMLTDKQIGQTNQQVLKRNLQRSAEVTTVNLTKDLQSMHKNIFMCM